MDFIEIQRLIYERMKTLDYPILDDYALYEEAEMPYVILSDLVLADNDTKNTEGLVVNQYVNIFSSYQGKKEVLEMAQRVSEVMNFRTDNIFVKQGKTTIMAETSNKGLFVSDRKYDKYYHAVLIFKIYIYEE